MADYQKEETDARMWATVKGRGKRPSPCAMNIKVRGYLRRVTGRERNFGSRKEKVADKRSSRGCGGTGARGKNWRRGERERRSVR